MNDTLQFGNPEEEIRLSDLGSQKPKKASLKGKNSTGKKDKEVQRVKEK